MKTDTPRPTQLEDYRPSGYLIDKVDLDFVLDETKTRVRARLKVRKNPAAQDAPKALRLNGENLELISIELNRQPVPKSAYRKDDKSLTILRPPVEPFTLTIVTQINPVANTALQGLYQSRGIYCTQCEAEGFRRITYFLDRPDILSVYTVRLEADPEKAPVLLSNGNPRERGTLDRGKRHYALWHDPHPKPCYLFALVAGDLSSIASTFTTQSGRDVDLAIYVERGKEPRAGWAMEALKKSMRWDEKRFGCEYDLDVFNIVAVSDFNMGAMENKGLNIFNDRLILASPETATDLMYQSIESVVAHEYFHNWTGNRITCRDWFQLCLKEGLTVYRDQEFSADIRSRAVQRIADVRQLKAHQFPEDAGPLAHPVRPTSYIEINNFYTATVYEKGAELVRMIATILGPKHFKAGMNLYFDRHDGEATTIEAFLTCFEEAADTDLSQFKLWYEQIGTPKLTCALSYNKKTKTATLNVTQSQDAPSAKGRQKPLHIPLRIGLLDAKGQDIPLTLENGDKISNGILHVTQESQSFKFKNVKSRPTPSLLRQFSAPVTLINESSDKDLEFLVANDPDTFNRWQAANTLASRTIIKVVDAAAAGKRSTQGTRLAKALHAALQNPDLEPAFKAELLTLPSPADIARQIETNVDYAQICAAHKQVSKKLARTLLGDLEKICETTNSRGRFSPNAKPAGKRALKNTALSYLAALGRAADLERIKHHFDTATNMTDEAHALHLIAASKSKHRQPALEAFYDRWQDDHIVIDTWFAAQARSPLDDTLETVRDLTKHERFTLKTPNKVRALIGSFALMNPAQFNRADGTGYKFLAEQIIALDSINPQIAARLANALRSWRSLEPKTRKKARSALSRIAKTPDLSKDVFEIINKTLGAPTRQN